jgi:hypothetical protein
MKYALFSAFKATLLKFHGFSHIKDVNEVHKSYRNLLLLLIFAFYYLINRINFLNMQFKEYDMGVHLLQAVSPFKSNIFYNLTMYQLKKL